MRELLFVGCGGFAGAVSRWLLTRLASVTIPDATFPVGTLLVNAIGCFAIGLVVEATDLSSPNASHVDHAIVIGFLGGFTTFSAFTHETVDHFANGNTTVAVLNVVVSLALCGAGVVLGRKLACMIGA